jgi:manganese transport protein
MKKLTFGPGAMVAAAFIGPGTVTTATAAGASFGLALLWAVLFSVVATLVLQELVVRSALVTGKDLAQLSHENACQSWWGWLVAGLIVVAIGLGNAAYQSGNLTGAGLGLEAALGGRREAWILAASVVAAVFILRNDYRWFERLLLGLVALMALLFIGLAILLLPDIKDLPIARLRPTANIDAQTTILALIGTTVVPYNLFLHGRAVLERWQCVDDGLIAARSDSAFSILLGGVITAAIVCAAAVLLGPADSPDAIAQLVARVNERFFGVGGALVGIGLFAAGLTSAVAAPLAAGWAVCGVFGVSTARQGALFRWVALSVLLAGVVFSLATTRPVALIVTAQATNGMLLPIVAISLAVIGNQKRRMGKEVNGLWANVLLAAVLCVVVGLAVSRLLALIVV